MVAVESDIVEGRKIRGGSFLYWPQMKAQKKMVCSPSKWNLRPSESLPLFVFFLWEIYWEVGGLQTKSRDEKSLSIIDDGEPEFGKRVLAIILFIARFTLDHPVALSSRVLFWLDPF